MAGEGGRRPWWPVHSGVNLANGNLHFELGSGSCVTCGGSSPGSYYVNPRASQLSGPTLIYNTLGVNDTNLGSKWMFPWDTYLEVDGSGNVTVIDADGTQRVYTKDPLAAPHSYTGDIESAVLSDDGTNYILTRCNGDKWVYPMQGQSHELQLTSITSRTGHSLTATYDGNDRLEKITDAYGRETKFFYITFGSITRLNEIREPNDSAVGFQSTFFGYDDSGRLIAITNPVGETTKFEYDGSNRISKAVDGHGHATEYTYDGSSRVTNIEDPAGNSTVIAYVSTTTTVTDRLSNDTVYLFDANKRLIKKTDALLNDREFTYDATTWEVATVLGPKIPVSGTPWTRQKFVYTYGGSSGTQHELHKLEIKKLSSVIPGETLLQSEEWTYNSDHDVLTYKDPRAHVTTYTYKVVSGSSIGLVETVKNALLQVIATYSYELVSGLYRAESYENGVSKFWSYDYDQNTANSYGIPDKVTAPSGAITNYKIDVRGRQYEVTPPTGNTTTMTYDELDRVIQITNPDGTSTRSIYDCCHLMAEVDENGNGSTYGYDDLGRMIKLIDQNGEETTYGYNAEGWQTSVTDPRGNTTGYDFDDLGRVIQVAYPGGWTENYTYFEPGMIKTKLCSKGASSTTITYEYDDLYRLKKKDFPSGTDTQIEYYENGLRKTIKDASGEKRCYYDDANRLTKVEQGPTGFVVGTNQNYVLEYTWNAASQVTQMKLTLRTQSAKTWDYVYLDDGELDTVTNPDGDVTDHQYLSDGRLKKIVLDSTATREFFYQDTNDSHAFVSDENSHLRKTLDKTNGGTAICSFAYELDAAGIRRSITDKDGKYRVFTYDPKYQLKSEMLWSAKVPGTRSDALLWTYDGNGNRLTQHDDGVLTGYVYGSNNEMTDAGSDAFTFDNFGNTASITGIETYSYDFESHMTQREASGGSTDTHEYDGDGRRMRSKLDDASDWTNFIHDELTENLICEYTLISGTFTIKALNTYGLGLISSNRQGTIRYFHFDGLGTTQYLTDSSQTVTDSYSYDAFGVPTSATGSSTNPYRYVGQWGYYDDGAMGSTSEMLLLGVRYYWPKYGRFTVWDALTSLAAYQYAINCPTHLTDPSGYIAVHPCRTRTASYCADARRKNGTSRANNCFCYVSWFICNQIAPSDGSAPIIGAAFLDCLNRCIFREYTLKRSDRWAKAKRSCDHYGADTIRCCVDMIRAEQAGFTDCLFSCNRLKGAGPKPRWWFYCTPDNPLSPSPFPFGSDENTRASKGIDLCCYGPYGGGAWKDLA